MSLNHPQSPRLASTSSTISACRLGELFGRALLSMLAVALLAFAGGILALGVSSRYYLLSFEARPEHPLHEVLRPARSGSCLAPWALR